MQKGHHLLVIMQALLICVSFFPLRAMLARGNTMEAGRASLLAVATLALPCFLSYAPLLAPEAFFLPFLIFGAYFLDQLLAGSTRAADGVGAGLCLGLATLTLYSAGVLWLSAVIALAPQLRVRNRTAIIAVALPVIIFLPWLMCNHAAIELSFNNALARFNFAKNALLYLIYGGAPLAGLVLVLAGLLKGKDFWNNGFFRFTFIAFVGLALYAAFTTDIIVERKLNYFTSRLLEPYFFLPLIVFARMDAAWRKDLVTNGLLLLFVLLLFGMPMNLHLDFPGGLAFWSGAGITSSAGVIRDVLYLALIAAPVGVLFWKPGWFLPGYIFVMFVMVATGLSATAFLWTHNEDGKIDSAAAQKIYASKDLQHVFAEYRCKGVENNDVAYLFRCYDTTRALYFLPQLPTYLSADELAQHPKSQLANAVFISTEHDNAVGPVVFQEGLARFQKIESAAQQPLVQITKIEGIKPYIPMPFTDRSGKLTMMDPSSSLNLESSAAGCVRMEMEWFLDKPMPFVSLQLNNGAVKKINPPLISKGAKAPLSVKLDLPKGASTLLIRYGDPKNPPQVPSLIIFDRPVFKSCKGK